MDVQFEEETSVPSLQARKLNPTSQYSYITRLVIKSGLAKDQRGANIVLVITTFLCLIAAGIILYQALFGHRAPISPVVSHTNQPTDVQK